MFPIFSNDSICKAENIFVEMILYKGLNIVIFPKWFITFNNDLETVSYFYCFFFQNCNTLFTLFLSLIKKSHICNVVSHIRTPVYIPIHLCIPLPNKQDVHLGRKHKNEL